MVLGVPILKHFRVLLLDKIHEKNIYRKDPKFLDRSSGQIEQISLHLRNPSD